MRNEGVEYLRRVDVFWKYHCGQFPIQEIEGLLDSLGVQLKFEDMDL